MKAEVRFLGIAPSDELRDYALRRLHLQLSRFSAEISSVVIRLKDVNGPRGGVDKNCQIQLVGKRIGVSVEELNTDPRAAIDLAVERLSRTVVRGMERARQNRNHGAETVRNLPVSTKPALARA